MPLRHHRMIPAATLFIQKGRAPRLPRHTPFATHGMAFRRAHAPAAQATAAAISRGSPGQAPRLPPDTPPGTRPSSAAGSRTSAATGTGAGHVVWAWSDISNKQERREQARRSPDGHRAFLPPPRSCPRLFPRLRAPALRPHRRTSGLPPYGLDRACDLIHPRRASALPCVFPPAVPARSRPEPFRPQQGAASLSSVSFRHVSGGCGDFFTRCGYKWKFYLDQIGYFCHYSFHRQHGSREHAPRPGQVAVPPPRRTPGKYRVQDSRKPSGAGRHTKHRERGRRLTHSPGRTTPHTGAAGGFSRMPGIAMRGAAEARTAGTKLRRRASPCARSSQIGVKTEGLIIPGIAMRGAALLPFV